MVKPPPVTFPVNVAIPAVLVIEISPVVIKPVMFWSAVPVIVIGELPAFKAVPLLIKSPVKFKTRLLDVSDPPLLIVIEPNVFIPEPENTRLLNVDAGIVCAADASKVTVPLQFNPVEIGLEVVFCVLIFPEFVPLVTPNV